MITACYERVSTGFQAEEGYSIDIQKEKLAAYCMLKGYGDYEHYTDGGFSGSNIDRPELTRLIQDCKDGKISRVVIYKLDRLSRSQKDTLYLIEEVFLPHGVDFVSINENFDTSTPFGRAAIGVMSVFAQLERENIFERTRAGMLERVRNGYWPGGARTPFGYDYDANTNILVPNQDADKVRRMYDLYIQGHSTYEISKILGFKHDKIVSQILTRKSNHGIIVYNGEEYQGRHEPLISKETYEKAMESMRRRSATRTPIYNNHLFAGLLECGVCGAKMRYQNGRIYCYSRQKSKSHLVKDPNCNNESHKAVEIEEIILDTFFQNTSRFKKEEGRNVKTSILNELMEQKQTLTLKIKRLYGLYGDRPDTFLLETIEQTQKQLDGIIKKISNEEERNREEASRKRLIEKITDIEDVWDSMSDAERRDLLHEAINKVTITHDEIEIDFNL